MRTILEAMLFAGAAIFAAWVLSQTETGRDLFFTVKGSAKVEK